VIRKKKKKAKKEKKKGTHLQTTPPSSSTVEQRRNHIQCRRLALTERPDEQLPTAAALQPTPPVEAAIQLPLRSSSHDGTRDWLGPRCQIALRKEGDAHPGRLNVDRVTLPPCSWAGEVDELPHCGVEAESCG